MRELAPFLSNINSTTMHYSVLFSIAAALASTALAAPQRGFPSGPCPLYNYERCGEIYQDCFKGWGGGDKDYCMCFTAKYRAGACVPCRFKCKD